MGKKITVFLVTIFFCSYLSPVVDFLWFYPPTWNRTALSKASLLGIIQFPRKLHKDCPISNKTYLALAHNAPRIPSWTWQKGVCIWGYGCKISPSRWYLVPGAVPPVPPLWLKKYNTWYYWCLQKGHHLHLLIFISTWILLCAGQTGRCIEQEMCRTVVKSLDIGR